MSGRPAATLTHDAARQRMTRVVEGWFLSEPLLFAAWTTHAVVADRRIQTIRVQHGEIHYNPGFIDQLSDDRLRDVLAFETLRILLGHPYGRRQPDAQIAYTASNLTVQECLRTGLPMPRARDVFDDESFDQQYFEFYYRELAERQTGRDDPPATDPPDPAPSQQGDDELETETETETDEGLSESNPDDSETSDDDATGDDSGVGSAGLESYADAGQLGVENTAHWDVDDLFKDELDAVIREAAESDGWGTVGGSAKQRLLATLRPKVDYRSVLRSFRQSVLSVRRRLTRMKPSRRYGFAQMGSRYEITTRLLFAVDVSGSMSDRDLQLGFSVVGGFFKYGIESIDVIWFDSEIRGDPTTLRRARREFEVTGRGGTDFRPVLGFIDSHREYDGLIIFTDGFAPAPPRPKNHRTQICWLFRDESTHQRISPELRPLGRTAFLKDSREP